MIENVERVFDWIHRRCYMENLFYIFVRKMTLYKYLIWRNLANILRDK